MRYESLSDCTLAPGDDDPQPCTCCPGAPSAPGDGRLSRAERDRGGLHPTCPRGRGNEGKPADLRSPLRAVQAGIGLVTENRKEEGLVLALSVAKNITLTSIDSVSTLGVVSQGKEQAVVGGKIAELDIKTPSAHQLVRNLSGGNPQKVVLAKWLTVDPELIVLCEPTRGVDVGAKVEIYRRAGNKVSQCRQDTCHHGGQGRRRG